MENLYHTLFKILLLFPVLGIINSLYLNKNFKIQKIINNSIYGMMPFLSFTIIILYTIYGKYNLELFTINENILVVFSINSLNLMFGLFLSIIILFLNISFQNSFEYLRLKSRYKTYNVPAACLYFLYFLLSFSTNILITIFLYMLVMVYSLFLIINPNLKDIRKAYSINFSITVISLSLLTILAGFYLKYNGDMLFILQNVKKLNEINIYWLIIVLFLLIFINFCAPIYNVFKEKIYYEDTLPLLFIFIIPFTILNTFIFIKVLYYIFYNNFSNIGLYFYYSGYFNILLFIISCFYMIKYITHDRKFTILFSFGNFLIFLSQLLFINSQIELVKAFSNFLMLILSMILSIITYSSVLFLLFASDITSTNFLYKKSKIELNFYIFCLFCPVLVNFISFFTLNFHNFNIFYLINLVEIFTIFCIYGIHIFLLTSRKNKLNPKEVKEVSQIEVIRYFAPQVVFCLLFLFILLAKNQIIKFISIYK